MRLADSSSAVLQGLASTLAVRDRSIQRARPWAAPAAQEALAVVQALEHVLDLADLRALASAALVRVAPAEHRLRLRPGVRSALLRVAALVVSSSIRRPKKVR